MARDDFEDADQLRIGNDGIFMLTFFSKCSVNVGALYPHGLKTGVASGGNRAASRPAFLGLDSGSGVTLTRT